MDFDKLSHLRVSQVFDQKGYRFYYGELNLNIFGVRSIVRRANQFDDYLCCAYQHNGQNLCSVWSGTTDPGNFWLEHPLNSKGAAILVPGQYPVYSIDLHRNAYKALCQRRGPVKVYRDNDRDNVLDLDPSTITQGEYGINIHHANPRGVTPRVDRNSAGCQVFEDVSDFNKLMSLAFDAERIYGNKFTYTLLDEVDFN